MVLMVTFLGSMVPNPGVVYEIEVTDHDASPPVFKTAGINIDGLKVNIPSFKEDGSGTNGEVIFHGDLGEKNKMVMIDHDDKSYTVMDKETMKAVGEQMSEAMRQAEEMIKNLPEEQQALIKKAREQGGTVSAMGKSPKREVKKTSERGTHQGYPCVKYEVFLDGKKRQELWVTEWNNIDGGSEAAEAFRAMGLFIEEMRNSIPNFMGGDLGGGQNFIEDLKALGGFPVITRDFSDGGTLESESTLRSATRRTLDPDAFEPPAGYKRKSMLGGEKK